MSHVVLLLTEKQARAIAASCPDAGVRALVAAADTLEHPRGVLLTDVGRGLEVTAVTFHDSTSADAMFDRMWKSFLARTDGGDTERTRAADARPADAADAGARARAGRQVARRRGAAAENRPVSRRHGDAPVCPVPAGDSGGRDSGGQ